MRELYERSVGAPDRPQSLQDTSSSGVPDFLFSVASPRQKSQYGDGAALFLRSSNGPAGIGTCAAVTTH